MGGLVIGRGIGIGVGVFAVLSALCLLTPLRGPLLAVAGRDTPALEHRMRAQRDTMDALQQRASDTRLSPVERTALDQIRNDYVATRERIDTRARMNARLTLLGLFDAVKELFPWLLAFGLALPVFGGLIAAQVKPRSRAVAVVPRPAPTPQTAPPVTPSTVAVTPPVPPVEPPVTPQPLQSPTQPRPVRPAYVHPAAAAAAAPATPVPPTVPTASPAAQRPLPGSPVILPPSVTGPAVTVPAAAPTTPVVPPAPETSIEIPPAPETPSQDWGFRHQPTPMETRPRTKLPPVRSPNSLGESTLDSDEEHA
jgi:hypothetical protein